LIKNIITDYHDNIPLSKIKILWQLENPISLSIAKSVKEQFDCDIFALIDAPKQIKKFFLEQRLVDLEKVWYYRDYISDLNKKPDREYLSLIEKKYGINLWKIVYSDRYFYQYNEYYKFSENEILRILEQGCKLYEDIFNEINPDFAVIKNPEYNQSRLMFEMCKGRGIRLLILGDTRFGYKSMISNQPGTIDDFNKILENYSNDKIKTFEELHTNLHGYNKQQAEYNKETSKNFMLRKILAMIYYFRKVCNAEYRNYYVNFGRTRSKVMFVESSFYFKKIYRQLFINQKLKQGLDTTTKFVYFPLHLQPERSTLMDAPFYTNQIEVIKNIAKSIPVEYKLYVKEHPLQGLIGWRDVSYYKQILDLPNVELLHPSVSNVEILKHCSLVLAITGTLGLEAVFYRKPTIVFGNVIYSSLPSVYKVKNIEELPELIRKALNTVVNISDVNKYTNCVLENSFEYDYIGINTFFSESFPHGYFIPEIEAPTMEILSVLDKIKDATESLASEYVKKIKEHQIKKRERIITKS
jgi:hypothetical protein